MEWNRWQSDQYNRRIVKIFVGDPGDLVYPAVFPDVSETGRTEAGPALGKTVGHNGAVPLVEFSGAVLKEREYPDALVLRPDVVVCGGCADRVPDIL